MSGKETKTKNLQSQPTNQPTNKQTDKKAQTNKTPNIILNLNHCYSFGKMIQV